MRLRERLATRLLPSQPPGSGIKKQPPTIERAVQEAAAKAQDGWKVKIHCKDLKGRAFVGVETISVQDAMELMLDDVDEYLRGGFGSGQFSLRVHNPLGVMTSSYSVNVGGTATYNPARGTQGNGDGGGSSGNSGGGFNQKEMFQMMLDANKVNSEMMMKMAEGQMEFWKSQAMNSGGDSVLDHPVMGQLIPTLFNNAFVQKENFFENLTQAMEFSKSLQPNIAAESDLASIMNMVGPIITALVASRGGGSVPQIVQGVQKSLQGQSEAELNSLLRDPAALQKHIDKLKTQEIAKTAALPQPGAQTDKTDRPDVTAQQASSPDEPGQHEVKDQEQAANVPDPHLALADSMIAQFRADIDHGANPAALASSLMGIVQYCRTLETAPRVMVGLLQAKDLESLVQEYERFCAAVPELAGNPERIESLKTGLIAELMGDQAETVEQIEPVGVTEPETVPFEPSQQESEQGAKALEEDAEYVRVDTTAGVRDGDGAGPTGEPPAESAKPNIETRSEPVREASEAA